MEREALKRYYIWTIGCQMNVVDSQRLAAGLERLGYRPTDRAEEAAIIVLNSCVVRQQPEEKVIGRLHQLRPLKEAHPDRILALMGCMVGQREAEKLRHRFPWVDLFLPPSDPGDLWEYLAQHDDLDEAEALIADAEARHRALTPLDALIPAAERGHLATAYLPIVLGCSHACTYCIIPYRRGIERSRPPATILAEAQRLVEAGAREITLLGQIVDRYGYDLPEFTHATRTPLVTLLEQLHTIEGLERIRFLTSHPNWMRDDLLDAVAALSKVCEHIEVPIQAGSDEILARMRRGYTVDDYRRLIERIRRRIPNASIATDIIVGFPGETAAQFQETYDLLAELQLDTAHIARYSPRPLTVASRTMADDVPAEEKERRRRLLDQLQAHILREKNATYLGKDVEVLVEGVQPRKNRWFGRTRRNRLVYFPRRDNGDLVGQMVHVHITWTGPWSLVGEQAGDAP